MEALLIALTAGAVVALLAVVVGYLRAIGTMVAAIEDTLATKVAPGARDVAGHLTAVAGAAPGLEAELAALLRG